MLINVHELHAMEQEPAETFALVEKEKGYLLMYESMGSAVALLAECCKSHTRVKAVI